MSQNEEQPLEVIERIIKRMEEPGLPIADIWLYNACKLHIEALMILRNGNQDRYLAEKRKARDLEIERDYVVYELNAVRYELQLSTARCKESKQVLANARSVLFTLEEHWNNPDYDEHHQIKKVIKQINSLIQKDDTIQEATEM